MLIYLYLLIFLFFIQSIESKIETISKIFKFKLINKKKKSSNNISIDSFSTFIFPTNLSFIRNLSLNDVMNETLISTNLSSSVFFSNTNNNNNTELEKEDNYCPQDSERLEVNNTQFEFQVCGPYNITISESGTELNHKMYQIMSAQKINSALDFNSILALQSLENISMVILDYINKTLKIIENNLDENSETLLNQTLKTMTKCNSTGNKFSCKINYLLFGMEGEKDDPFLAKDIPESTSLAFFDNLSSYTIFPYEYLSYFLSSFFSKYNDECRENNIQGTTLYYVTCSKKKIEIFSYARNMSVIINNFAYPLKNLFNDSFRLLGASLPELIYFNILFNKSSNYFIFGSNFFIGKQIGYNFLDNSTYIYSEEYNDFTSNFSGENSSTFQFLLYALTLGLFSCFLILSAIMNWLHTRQVNKELENILK